MSVVQILDRVGEGVDRPVRRRTADVEQGSRTGGSAISGPVAEPARLLEPVPTGMGSGRHASTSQDTSDGVAPGYHDCRGVWTPTDRLYCGIRVFVGGRCSL